MASPASRPWASPPPCTTSILPCVLPGRRCSARRFRPAVARSPKPADAGPNPGYLTSVTPSIALPDAPSVVAGHGRAAILTLDGELLLLPPGEAVALLRTMPPPILVHAPATFRRLGMRPVPAFDLLELFAFVRPACTVAPTPRGLALALDDDQPSDRP